MIGGNDYVTTKAALEAHTVNLAAEVARTRVTATSIDRGPSTPLCRHRFAVRTPRGSVSNSTHDSSVYGSGNAARRGDRSPCRGTSVQRGRSAGLECRGQALSGLTYEFGRQEALEDRLVSPTSLSATGSMAFLYDERLNHEGPFDERLRVMVDARAMRDDQLVEVPRQQVIERLPARWRWVKVSRRSSGTPPCGAATPLSANTALLRG